MASHFRGKMVSETETWSYDAGHIHCEVGNYKNYSFTWQQNTFSCPTSTEMGYGLFDASTGNLDYFFPHSSRPQDHEKFFSLDISHTKEEATFSCNHMLWLDKLTWVYHKENKTLSLVPPNDPSWIDRPEGSERQWEVQGDVPLLAAVLVGLFARVQELHRLRIEHLRRNLVRCNKFVGPVGKPAGFLCEGCVSRDECCNCTRKSPTIKGISCKSCALRINFCVRCGVPRGESRVPALLCDMCGIGKLAENCCRMVKAR